MCIRDRHTYWWCSFSQKKICGHYWTRCVFIGLSTLLPDGKENSPSRIYTRRANHVLSTKTSAHVCSEWEVYLYDKQKNEWWDYERLEKEYRINAYLLWTIYKVMFEFVLLVLLTYWVGNLSVVALGANVINNVEFYTIWGLVLFLSLIHIWRCRRAD